MKYYYVCFRVQFQVYRKTATFELNKLGRVKRTQDDEGLLNCNIFFIYFLRVVFYFVLYSGKVTVLEQKKSFCLNK